MDDPLGHGQNELERCIGRSPLVLLPRVQASTQRRRLRYGGIRIPASTACFSASTLDNGWFFRYDVPDAAGPPMGFWPVDCLFEFYAVTSARRARIFPGLFGLWV